MLTSLERLEKEKTALILCISFSHTETLHTIRNGVDELVGTTPVVDSIGSQFSEVSKRAQSQQDQPVLKVSCWFSRLANLITDFSGTHPNLQDRGSEFGDTQ